MTPLTKYWATISQEIEPEISCGPREKVACQLIEIDKPLFRERQHERQSSMSSSQAADRLYPCKPGYSFPPLLLLSHEHHSFPWAPRETVVFVGAQEKVGLSFVRGVISQAHVLGNDWISFYSAVCGRRNSLQEGFFAKLRPGRLPRAFRLECEI